MTSHTPFYLVLLLPFSLGIASPGLAHTSKIFNRPIAAPTLLTGRPSNLGYPQDGTRRGGGSRGGVCDVSPGTPPLTALMPDTSTWTDSEQSSLEDVVFSLTQQSSPDIWIYVPYIIETSNQLLFTLKDDANNQLMRVQLASTENLPSTPGIIQVSFNSLGVNLLPNVDYHWYVTVNCEQGPPVVVDGWLRHQVDRAEDAPEHTFFVDDLSSLVQTTSSDASARMEWQALLKAVGLEDISTAPIVNCCRLVN
ncbi:MAG: DUF928 domain-containing protein [Cyanobacteria bacterium P01_D01_bin.156]